MMGLSYECEPIMRKLETHFAGQIDFRYAMGLLVRNVHDFMMPEDYADTEAESIVRYNARLATDRFLYNLRYATIVDTRSTTRLDEILKVVSQTGIDEKRFLQHYRDSSAESALDGDLTRMHALGIHALPAYLLAYEGKQMLIRHLIGFDAFSEVIRRLSDGSIRPLPVEQSLSSVRQLLEQHPLISPIELREALDFRTTDEIRAFVQPLIDSGEIAIREVPHGYFIVNIQKEKQI